MDEMVVRRTAALAKLALTPEEESRMGGELASVLDFARTLGQIDLTDVPITAHVVPVENVLRDDSPAPFPERDALLGCAPVRTAAYVAVPNALE